MIRIGRDVVGCPACGSDQLSDVSSDMDQPSLEYIECECGAAWKLETLVTLARPATRRKARASDPGPSHEAAQLDFSTQQRAVLAALVELGGRSDATEITAHMNAQGAPIQRSVTSRRLTDLLDAGAIRRDGEHRADNGRTVTIYQATEATKDQAA